MNEEKLIRENIPSLLSHRQVKTKMGSIDGTWSLLNDEVGAYHGTQKNIEFTLIFENGAHCVQVTAKLHRETAKLSNIAVRDL